MLSVGDWDWEGLLAKVGVIGPGWGASWDTHLGVRKLLLQAGKKGSVHIRDRTEKNKGDSILSPCL